jgi:large subunit ribosomal protein L17
VGNRKGDNAPMAVIELVEALTVAQQAVGEAERARGTRFAPRKGAASAAGEVTADAVETAEADDTTADDTAAEETSAEDTAAEDSPEEIVDDVFLPDGERQDDGDVTPEPERENAAVVDSDNVSPEVAAAAAAEVEAAELGDAATAGVDAPGGESAPDPK